MSDPETDVESCIVIVSDTDDSGDDIDIKAENVLVPNMDKNQNPVPKTKSTNWPTKCKLCKRQNYYYSSTRDLNCHMMKEHGKTFVECPVSSGKKQIKSIQMRNHLHQSHNSNSPRIGARISTRISAQVIKTESTVSEATKAICENHQVTCEVCNHRIILPKGIPLAHGQHINPTSKCTSTSMNRSGTKTTAKRTRSPDINYNDQNQTKQNRSFTSNSVAHSYRRLPFRFKITKKEMQCCPFCKEKFPNDRIAAEHYQKIHKRTVLGCKFCNKYYASPGKLKIHIGIFHASKK